MPEPLRTLLDGTPIFRKLDERDRADLAGISILKKLTKGEFLAHQGQVWPYLLLVDKGVLKTHKVSPQGRSLGAMRLQAGALFCSPTLLDEGPLPATLEADTDCRLYLWHQEHLLPYLQNNNQALWELSTLLVSRMRQASEIVEDLAFQPVAGRVARLLLKQHQRSADNLVARELTLDEMAAMVGTTPVMVCKVLSQFADQGWLKVSRTEIEFIDRSQLERIIEQY